jgi:hypothetical protein
MRYLYKLAIDNIKKRFKLLDLMVTWHYKDSVVKLFVQWTGTGYMTWSTETECVHQLLMGP